ncbi:hypothetical protein ABK040_015386 [Willaertia magna]
MGVTGSKQHQNATSPSQPSSPKGDDKYYDFVPAAYNETKVPTMFRWPYGGRKVYIIGSFNNWSEKIPMSYNSEEEAFVVILNVSVGKHFYRFIVDGEYTTDLNSPTEKDELGYLSNVVEISADEESGDEMEEEEEEDEIESNSSSSSTNVNNAVSSPVKIHSGRHESGHNTPHSSPPRRPVVMMGPMSTAPQPFHTTSHGSHGSHHSQQQPVVNVSPHQTHHHNNQVPPQQHHHHHTTTNDNEQKRRQENNEQITSPTKEKDGDNKQWSSTYGYHEEYFPENKKNPPILPPHLRYTPLNSSKKFHHDPGLLPIPLHVTVNHAYFAERDNMNKVGITQRYKDKFSTVVLYKPKQTELRKHKNNTN